MKKRPAATYGRSCPRCSKLVDQVFYGWHASQCLGSGKPPTMTPTLQEVPDDSSLKGAHPLTPSGDVSQSLSIHMPPPASNPSVRLEGEDQEDPRLLSVENRREQSPDPIKQEIQQLRREYQALFDKMKNLELKVEDLQTQLMVSRADSAGRDTLCSCKSVTERGLCTKSTQTLDVGMVKFDSKMTSGIVSQACENGPRQEVQPLNMDTCFNVGEPIDAAPPAKQACGEDISPSIAMAKQNPRRIIAVGDHETRSENLHSGLHMGRGLACGGDVTPKHGISNAGHSLEEENVNYQREVGVPGLDESADGTCNEANEDCQLTLLTRQRRKVMVSSSDDSAKVSWKVKSSGACAPGSQNEAVQRKRVAVATSSESSHGTRKKDADQECQPTSRRVRKKQRVVMSSSGDSADILRKAANEETSTGCAPNSPKLRRVVLPVSDDSTNATENDECEHRSIHLLKDQIGSIDNGITSRDNKAVHRTKRIRGLSFQTRKEDNEDTLAGVSPTTSAGSPARSRASQSSRSISSQTNGERKARRRLFEECRKLYTLNKDDSEEIDSESESSLDGFITESEGREDSVNSDEYDSTSGSFLSEGSCELKSKNIERMVKDLKVMNYAWENEAEMLVALGRDANLCLRAICALNRRQTDDEQRDKEAKYVNKRGFDKLHAARGTRIAEFLTDGDPSGPVKKSIEELKVFDAYALRFCKRLAFKHSKQLFDMYGKEEDPHFPSS